MLHAIEISVHCNYNDKCGNPTWRFKLWYDEVATYRCMSSKHNMCRTYTSNPGNIIMVADLLEVQEETLSDAICEINRLSSG